MQKKSGKNKKHTWEFTRYFRAGAYKWNGTALASKRINAAIREIKKAAKKDSVVAAQGAILFIEKCWRALEHIIANRFGSSANKSRKKFFLSCTRSSFLFLCLLSLMVSVWGRPNEGPKFLNSAIFVRMVS